MPSVIYNAKDGIDEMIEKGKAIDRMFAGKPETLALREAREAMAQADAWLTRARAAAARVDSSRLTV